MSHYFGRPQTTEATDETIESAAHRIAEALQQLHGHDESIQRGEWITQGLHPAPTTHIVVTFGRFATMNGPFFRPLIHEQLKKLGVPLRPFVVLSLQEFDSVISLMDQGMALDKIATELLNTDSFDVLHQYREQLGRMAISNYSSQRTHDLLEQIRPIKLAP